MVPSWVDDPAPEPTAPLRDSPSDLEDGSDAPPDDGKKPNMPDKEPASPSPYPMMPLPVPGQNYSSARSDMTFGSRTGNGLAIRRSAGKFVSASGGGQGAARQLVSSRALAGHIVILARSVAESGPTETLRPFELEELAGAPAEEVFLALTDALCPPGGTIDEAIARDALLETIADLAANGVGNFDELTLDDLHEVFVGVVARSIEGRILNEVGTNIIKLSPNLAAIERTQKMLRSFVFGCVRDQFQASGESISSLDASQIDGFVMELYAASFELVQTTSEAE